MGRVRIEIKWAVIFTIASLVWMSFERWVGWHDSHIDKHSFYTNMFGIVAVGIYLGALIDKRNNYYGGIMTYQQGFIAGLALTLFIAILSPLGQYLTHNYITPYYFENAIEHAVASNTSSFTDASDFFSLNNYIIYSLIGSILMGIVITALLSLFVRKN